MGKRLNLRMEDEIYEKIKENAEKIGLSMNKYIIHAAADPVIIRYNYDAVREHLKEIQGIHNDILELIGHIVQEETVFMADMDKLYRIADKLLESEKSLLSACKKERNVILKIISGEKSS
ncbi:toxin-antitoxin system HicB family antitoxin [Paenibacillus polygoni]|uniref:Toxin-antitoxin system HicB family antitoxin n=1 Tax=Paenibacillus polygoni TaxID=3050112 RepID=A0ABY8X6Y1_9BACL|nr:toxin-antitoxin system HicB family antitoxin [Paenibacillus polygoni]WIV19734.1 toxin-antitoxin system HicB family antitoxin [Paenibacillus polygoni]